MLKLYMILVGFKPKGFLTEQHDVVFVVGTSMNDPRIIPTIFSRLPIPSGTRVHIDAWVEVTHAHGYKVFVAEGARTGSHTFLPDLYFVNLGGYRKGDFAEHHKKLLLVLDDSSQIKKAAESDSFYEEMDFIERAEPHVDDPGRLNAEVEDELRVADVLDGYYLVLEFDPEGADSLKNPVIEGFKKIGLKP